MKSVWLQLLSLCAYQWSVLAQFGSISLSIGLGDSKNDDDPGNSLDFRGACPPNTSCVPISSCALLGDLLDVSCFSSDKYFHRLNQLTCGQVDNEDYVCCPSCDCGRVYQQGAERCGQSMVRGVDYHGLGAQPWVARVGFTHKETGNVRFACSGSIISKRVVLTAAHCALAKPEGYKLSTIVVGEYDIGKSPDCSEWFCAPPTQALRVDRVVVHPGYEQKIFRHDIALIVLKEEIKYSAMLYIMELKNSSRRGKSPDCSEWFCAPPTQALRVAHVVVHPGYEQKIFRHDIALIVLKEEIKYSVTAAPVCLNEKPEIVLNERASLVGWGKLSGQNSLVSRQQQLQVPLVPLANCERIFGESVPVHEGQLCAGGEEGRDACSGFGGAPLLLNRDGKSVQIGIVSFGSENCGSEGVPSVYTNIAHYYRWIVENSPSS